MLDFFNDDVFNIECDMVVVPISTVGTISDAFKNSFERLKIKFILKSQSYKLGEIELQEFPQNSSFKFIAFVCTVEEYSSSYYAIQMIGRSLGEKLQDIDDVKEIATPILGTGAGKLDPYQSRNILFSAFYETAPNFSRLTFCTPDKNIYQSFEGLSFDNETPSGQLVIEAELPRISETDFIEKLQYEKEFFYDLAVQKFHEYLNYKSSDTNFYLRIEEDFKSSGLTFKDFLPQKEQFKEQYLFLSLCGELIAYIDYHAFRKNIWNKYPDKRVLANSTVRQNIWILNLIKYKRTENIKNLSSSIRNSFQYLQEPALSLTMLSDKHRERVFNQILLQKYDGEEAVYKLLDLFKKLGFKTSNSENYGALCSRILYLPYIKPIWLNTFSNFNNDKIVDEGIEEVDIFQASMLIDESLRNKSKRLDLGNCGLQNLTVIPELFECKDLEELILSNEWAEYENGKWRKHTSKNKGKKNTILFLPDEIKNLKNLKRLVCGGDWNNQKNKWNRWSISSISHLIELKKLEYLNVSNNRLKNIKGLNQLTELKTVHLNNVSIR